jgi:hypothetical protein
MSSNALPLRDSIAIDFLHERIEDVRDFRRPGRVDRAVVSRWHSSSTVL